MKKIYKKTPKNYKQKKSEKKYKLQGAIKKKYFFIDTVMETMNIKFSFTFTISNINNLFKYFQFKFSSLFISKKG